MEVNNKEKLAQLKKQIRVMQDQRIRIENFDKKAKKSTQRWQQELKNAKKLVKPGEVIESTDAVKVRVDTAEQKISDFSNNQQLLRDNFKTMTNTVYQLFQEIEATLPLEEKVRLQKQIQYCINF